MGLGKRGVTVCGNLGKDRGSCGIVQWEVGGGSTVQAAWHSYGRLRYNLTGKHVDPRRRLVIGLQIISRKKKNTEEGGEKFDRGRGGTLRLVGVCGAN